MLVLRLVRSLSFATQARLLNVLQVCRACHSLARSGASLNGYECARKPYVHALALYLHPAAAKHFLPNLRVFLLFLILGVV
ncbi:hypothetical protein R3P38DRAFT_3071470 [Favolaschia claudopus]|uniref:Secreted protein n=1 Tax=Favolaschia claudopus TaxID=2862362 RepID=A0AAV9ZZQ4_9AGAR